MGNKFCCSTKQEIMQVENCLTIVKNNLESVLLDLVFKELLTPLQYKEIINKFKIYYDEKINNENCFNLKFENIYLICMTFCKIYLNIDIPITKIYINIHDLDIIIVHYNYYLQFLGKKIFLQHDYCLTNNDIIKIRRYINDGIVLNNFLLNYKLHFYVNINKYVSCPITPQIVILFDLLQLGLINKKYDTYIDYFSYGEYINYRGIDINKVSTIIHCNFNDGNIGSNIMYIKRDSNLIISGTITNIKITKIMSKKEFMKFEYMLIIKVNIEKSVNWNKEYYELRNMKYENKVDNINNGILITDNSDSNQTIKFINSNLSNFSNMDIDINNKKIE
jgi:hypothetical protein